MKSQTGHVDSSSISQVFMLHQQNAQIRHPVHDCTELSLHSITFYFHVKRVH